MPFTVLVSSSPTPPHGVGRGYLLMTLAILVSKYILAKNDSSLAYILCLYANKDGVSRLLEKIIAKANGGTHPVSPFESAN